PEPVKKPKVKKHKKKVLPAETAGITDIESLKEQVKKKRSDHTVRLQLAQALWKEAAYDESLEHYGQLIRAGAEMEGVMDDLQHYIKVQPESPGLLRTLGDAYMKAGLLEKALKIYNQAMNTL
ncbi:MAG: hypothetical protein JW981_05245, partial [Anaerolineae bacterium]|nr:hypothetical protein [Anaerolineae bacterium]